MLRDLVNDQGARRRSACGGQYFRAGRKPRCRAPGALGWALAQSGVQPPCCLRLRGLILLGDL